MECKAKKTKKIPYVLITKYNPRIIYRKSKLIKMLVIVFKRWNMRTNLSNKTNDFILIIMLNIKILVICLQRLFGQNRNGKIAAVILNFRFTNTISNHLPHYCHNKNVNNYFTFKTISIFKRNMEIRSTLSVPLNSELRGWWVLPLSKSIYPLGHLSFENGTWK